MPYDPTSEADIAAAIQMARATNAVEPDLRPMVESVYNPKPVQAPQPYQFGDTMGEMTAEGRRDISQGQQTQQDIYAKYPPGTIMPNMSPEDQEAIRSAAFQKIGGFGSTVYNAAASVIPEILPSWLVGEPWQRKQLAQDIGAMPDAFAGMGSAMVGPSYERAANMTRNAVLGEDAARLGVQTARAVVNENPMQIPLAVADMEPAMVRSTRIKLGGGKDRPNNTQAFMDELYDNAQANPYNPRELIVGNTGLDITPFGNEIHLGDIRSLAPGSGAGTETLDFLKSLADKHGVSITGTAKAYMDDPRFITDTDRLAKWYEKRGFEIGEGYPEEGYDISYTPKKPSTMIRSEIDPSALSPEANPLADIPQIEQPLEFAKLNPGDLTVVNKIGQTPADQKIIAETLKRVRDNYSPKKGFGDFEVVGGKFEKTKTGERIFVPQVREQAYDFHTPPPNMDKGKWANQMSNKVVKEVSDVVQRAKGGDQAAAAIVQEARWYRAMRERMRQEFGGLGDVFADLLGTTSAQTGVTQNWNNAIEILRRFSRGEYDRELNAYQDLLQNGGDTNPIVLQQMFKAGQFPLITKATGELFNANSPAATRALLDMFRDIKAGVSPKTPNFTGNLIGFSKDATVDVWAARMLRRLSGKKPIPPAAEKAVGGKHAAGSTLENPRITGEFGFGQDVFRNAADKLNKSGVVKNYDPSLGDIGADDLQAIAWFIEKERWTKKGWTSKAGEGGSLDMEANLAGASDPKRVRELRAIASKDFEPPKQRKTENDEAYAIRLNAARDDFNIKQAEAKVELDNLAAPLNRYTLGISRQRPGEIPSNYGQAELAAPLDAVVRDDPAVVAYQVNSTIGRFMGENERALNAEFVVRSDFNPNNLKRAMVEAGKEYNQDAVFMSKVLRSPTESPNARPGIEIYFNKKLPQNIVEEISNELTKHGIDGFTFVTDARQSDRVNVQAMSGQPDTAGLVGIRFQYIPEFDDGFDVARRAEIMAEKQEAYEDIAAQMLAKYPQVSNADVVWYDTDIMFRGDYDAYLGATGKARGGEVWQGQPYRSNAPGSTRQPTDGRLRSEPLHYRVGGAAGEDWQSADIEAALNTARQHFEGGGVAISQGQIDEGINEANASLQEIRGAKALAQDQAYDNMSWGDWAKGVGQNLYGMKDIGLFHDIIPGALQSAKQAVTLPGRVASGEVDVYNNDQMIPEALNVAGFLTGGAGIVPAEANSLRIGFSGRLAKTADKKAIRTAKDLYQAGVPPKEIWEQTGYFPHPSTGEPLPPMVRYEQPQDLFVDVDKLQKAPTYDYKYDLPEVFSEKSFEAAYPEIYQKTPVNARFRDGKQPASGAAMTPGIYSNYSMIKPPELFMGNVSAPGYQATKGEIGSVAHELNHTIQDFEQLPLAAPPQKSIEAPISAVNSILTDPSVSMADKAYYRAVGQELADLYNKNPALVQHALYLHNASEAMSRVAELMAAYPELRSEYPLDLLDVKPSWMFSTYKQKSGAYSMNQDPTIALEIAKWATSPEGAKAMREMSLGNAHNLSVEPVDVVTSAINAAKGNQP